MVLALPAGTSWTLTFDDEFNGTTLNRNNWTPNWTRGLVDATQAPMQPTAEFAPYSQDQVAVSGGSLHLMAVPANVTADDGTSFNYCTGMVQTSGLFEQSEGYFEAKIFLPGSGGKIANWPAFWMNGWTGEVDIVEGIGGHASYHFHAPTGEIGSGYVGADMTGWHVYGVLWQAGRMQFYQDNVLVGTVTKGVTDGKLYMVLVNSIGGYGDAPRLVPSDMKVDWVHVYSSDPSAKGIDPEEGYTGLGDVAPRDLVGGGGRDVLRGGLGNDELSGAGGNDVITGTSGRDLLSGGPGSDKFEFDSVNDSMVGKSSDRILDFSQGQRDRIDLSTIDANTNRSGDQAFVYIGAERFHEVAGELRYANGAVLGDVDGNGVADFRIFVDGGSHLTARDFIL